MRRVLAIGALASALSGCGTVSNLRRGPITDAAPYGGVKIAVEQCKEEQGDFIRFGFPAPLDVTDVALSAVGDTVTLPVTATMAVWRSGERIWNLVFHYNEPTPGPSAWREFWFSNADPAPPVGP